MADLIAKVSRMDGNRQESSHASHLRSQDLSHQHPAKNESHKPHHTEAYQSPAPSKNFGISTSSSAIELDTVAHPWDGTYEINVKSEVQIQVDEMGSEAGTTKEGSVVGHVMVAGEDDTRPLRGEY